MTLLGTRYTGMSYSALVCLFSNSNRWLYAGNLIIHVEATK